MRKNILKEIVFDIFKLKQEAKNKKANKNVNS